MKINPEQYRMAANQRANTARVLWNGGRYSASIYMAGVAVECMLRAYITRVNSTFDDRHDLNGLLKSSGLETISTPHYRRQVNAFLGDVWLRWKNGYRYASDNRLRSEFKSLGFQRGIMGDFLKENARITVDAALELTAIGELQWTSTSK